MSDLSHLNVPFDKVLEIISEAVSDTKDDICIALEKLKNDDEEGVYWGRDQDMYNIAIDDVIHFIREDNWRGFFNNSEKNDD